ncbi:MAG: type II secretion system protein GspN [Deltaproteobacteria bacterium]|nr:MAG: type II secretion system protein GspN [Deltaproteobacteria bacterium]
MAEAASAPTATTPLQKLRAFALPVGTVLAFLVFLLATFPFDTLARRIEIEVQRAGGDITIGSMGPAFLGFRARDVRLRPPSSSGLRPDLLALLGRRTSFSFAASAFSGTAKGHAALSNDPRTSGSLQSLTLEMADLDLRSLPLKEAFGVELLGRVSGKTDLPTLVPTETTTGTITLSIKGLALANATVQGLTLPRTVLGDLDASIVIDKGTARVERTQTKGGDIDLDLEGTIRMRPLFSLSQADLRLKLRPAERWLSTNQSMRGLLGLLQRQPDGGYLVPLNGPLSRLQPPVNVRF